jgi:RNA polymerase sigma factor (sigma-70 family)
MNQTEIADSLLWSQFKKGDRNAFAVLYERFAADCLAYGLTLSSDRGLLQDAVQDLFIELWNSREQLAQLNSIKFYLFKALRYKIIHAEKRIGLQNKVAMGALNRAMDRSGNTVEEQIIDKEIGLSRDALLRAVIQKLTRRQQELIQLRFYEGFSTEQIAELMNLNYQSVSNLMFSALSRIRKILRKPAFVTSLAAVLFLFL